MLGTRESGRDFLNRGKGESFKKNPSRESGLLNHNSLDRNFDSWTGCSFSHKSSTGSQGYTYNVCYDLETAASHKNESLSLVTGD